MMQLCERCKAEMAEPECDSRFSFPCFSVAGAVLGAVGAATTGMLVLVPAGLIAGALGDVRRCENCGEEDQEQERSYALMEAGEDGAGATVFVPARSLGGRAVGEDLRRVRLDGDRDSGGPCCEEPWYIEPPPDAGSTGDDHHVPSEAVRYRYDELEEMLVPIDMPQAEEGVSIDYEWTLGPEFGLRAEQFTGFGRARRCVPEEHPDTEPREPSGGAGEPGAPFNGGDL